MLPPSASSTAGGSPARTQPGARHLPTRASPSTVQSWLRPARCTGAHPAHSTARRATAVPSGGVWGGRVLARPPRLRAGATEPAPQGPMCSLRPARARRLRPPLRALNGRARRPLNGPAAPPVGFGWQPRRRGARQRTSSEGRDGLVGRLRLVHGRCTLLRGSVAWDVPRNLLTLIVTSATAVVTCNSVIMTRPLPHTVRTSTLAAGGVKWTRFGAHTGARSGPRCPKRARGGSGGVGRSGRYTFRPLHVNLIGLLTVHGQDHHD